MRYRKQTVVIVMLIILASNVRLGANDDPYYDQRKKMIGTQIVSRGIKNKTVLDAIMKVPRHEYVPAAAAPYAYIDGPLSIGFGQTISQPYIVALMTDLAKINKEDKVLEIGTGSGYQAAILGELAEEVYTIEIIKELAESSAKRLSGFGYTNVHVRHGDGYMGWPEEAPFDAIIVTAAPEEIPETLTDQLVVGGRLIIPVGGQFQNLKRVIKTDKGFWTSDIIPVRFVPMVHGEERPR
ncbi:MAG: protein-L-isoaspartate(D-aspartate) O-methyltransferase [Candidatus Omnitrophota bacterium]